MMFCFHILAVHELSGSKFGCLLPKFIPFLHFWTAVEMILLLLFQKAARWLVFGKAIGKKNVDSEVGKKKMRKFKESAWKCIYFLSAELMALYVTYNEPWFTNTKYFWVGPGHQVWPDQKIKLVINVSVIVSSTRSTKIAALFSSLCIQVTIEGSIHVCCWILHLFHIRSGFLGN